MDENHLEIKGVILEDKSGSFKNEKGELVEFKKFVAQVNGKVRVYKATKDVDITSFVGDEATIVIEETVGSDFVAKQRVIELR